jgi:hypothetical protein
LPTLLDQWAGARALGWVGGALILTFLMLEFTRLRRSARIVFLVMLACGLLALGNVEQPVTLFAEGWRRGAVYAAFFLALTTLRDAAETSPLVRKAGRHLVAQPPGRRYAALASGGHVFSIILSYGAIELLGSMIARTGASGELRQRMLLAAQRGFCVMNCWNPLNLMTVVVTTAIPTAPMHVLAPLGLGMALLFMAVGFLEDRLTHPSPPSAAAVPGWRVHLRLILLVGLVMGAAELASLWFRVPLVAAVTLVVPLTALLWILTQTARWPTALPGLLQRRAERFARRAPGFRGEAMVLATSGFMGVTVGAALPDQALGPWIGSLPPVIVPLLVPVALIATGQMGLNPVAIVALIGAAIPNPEALGVSSAQLAFACMLGWGLAVGVTPMSASAIITARWAEVSPWVVGSRWNAAYTACGLVLAWVAIALV